MKNILIYSLLIIMIPTMLVANKKSDSNEKRFVLKVSLWHSLTGDKITHEMEISEQSKFDITANIENTKWVLSGRLGKLVENEIPLKTHIEWYKDKTSNEKTDSQFNLKLSEEERMGVVHGVFINVLIQNKTGKQINPPGAKTHR